MAGEKKLLPNIWLPQLAHLLVVTTEHSPPEQSTTQQAVPRAREPTGNY